VGKVGFIERGYQMHNPLYPYPTDGSLDFHTIPPARPSRRILLRLRQSADGLGTASELAVSPETRDLAAAAAQRRAELEQKLTRAIAERNGDVSPKSDIAGRLHRVWMRFLTTSTDDRLLAEIDRGEASAERAAKRAATRFSAVTGSREDDVADLLSRVVDEIAVTRDKIDRLRKARDLDQESISLTKDHDWHRRAI